MGDSAGRALFASLLAQQWHRDGVGVTDPPGDLCPPRVSAPGRERGREEEMPVRRGCHSNGVREDSSYSQRWRDVPEHPQGSRDSEASGTG